MGADAPTGMRGLMTDAQNAELPDQRGIRSWAFAIKLKIFGGGP